MIDVRSNIEKELGQPGMLDAGPDEPSQLWGTSALRTVVALERWLNLTENVHTLGLL